MKAKRDTSYFISYRIVGDVVSREDVVDSFSRLTADTLDDIRVQLIDYLSDVAPVLGIILLNVIKLENDNHD